MNRFYLLLAILCSWIPAATQQVGDSFNDPVITFPLSPVAKLSQKITKDCRSEYDKVKAIFTWITENIDYMVKAPRVKKVAGSLSEDTVSRSLDERVAITVLERRVAICEGYARLFKTLCDYAGLHAVIIHGYARANRGSSRFGSNHTWNAVMIDNEWKLLDVTWASGYVNWPGNIFTRELDEHYFLTPPEKFIWDHYPDEIAWTLLREDHLVPEFRHSPFRQRSFVKYQIRSFSPGKGLIEAAVGDTINLELETADLGKDKQIGSDPFLDLETFEKTGNTILKPYDWSGNTIRYQYTVSSPESKWVYLLYNNDLVLRYRVQVKSLQAN